MSLLVDSNKLPETRHWFQIVCVMFVDAWARGVGSLRRWNWCRGPIRIRQHHCYKARLRTHCGGARPPKELMDNLTKPSPFPGKKVYIRSGTENSLDKPVIRELIADTGGRFSLLLPSGTYCIIQEEQVKTLDTDFFRKKLTSYHKLDEECLKQWWGKCLMTFEIGTSDKTGMNINFHFPCFTNGVPCVTYTGPLPQ